MTQSQLELKTRFDPKNIFNITDLTTTPLLKGFHILFSETIDSFKSCSQRVSTGNSSCLQKEHIETLPDILKQNRTPPDTFSFEQ